MNINSQFNSPITGPNDISKLISSFSSNAIVIGGVLFLIFVIIAGYQMLNNSGDSQKFASGKDVITYAVMGFLIIFGAYWIIQLLQLMLGIAGTDAAIIK